MKKFIFTIFILLYIVSCCSEKISQNNKDECEVNFDGGLSDIELDSELVKKSYDFLKEELAVSNPYIDLVSIKEAKSQVVAGINIVLICEYKTNEIDKIYVLYSKIFNDLSNGQKILELYLNYK